MISISNTYFTSQRAGKLPVIVCRISTQRTSYLLSRRALNDDERGALGGISLWDGSVSTGDGGTFGGLPVSEIESRVLQFGSVDKSLVTNAKDLPASLSQGQIGVYSLQCDNIDGWFSRLLGENRDEPLLGQRLEIFQGYKGDPFSSYVTKFSGEITQIQWTASSCRITAEDVASVYPETTSEESLDVYAVRGDGTAEMAEETFSAASCANFLAADSWLFTSNLIKDDLSDAGVIFEIENTLYNATVLQIGIDASNYPYATVGTDVEGSFAETTYTSTTALTAADIATPINLRVRFDNANAEITFTVDGVSTTVPAATPYDRTGISDNVLRFGNGFDGDIQNWIWNSQHYWVNNQGDNTLTGVPDVIGVLDVSLTSGSWVVWPSI